MRTVRRIFWLVMLLIWGLIAIAGANKFDSLAIPLAICVLAWWYMGMFFSRLIGMTFVSSIRCKGCGLEIPAVAQWRIGSYSDHRERHILWAKNPMDGSRVGHIDCPQCSSTIIV